MPALRSSTSTKTTKASRRSTSSCSTTALKARDAKLAKRIIDKIEDVEDFVKGKTISRASIRPACNKAAEELAVLLQSAAPKLKLKKPAVGE